VHGHERHTRAAVILGGVDVEKFSPGERAIRTGAALFVGRLLPHKGVDDLIRALPPEMALTIVGPEPDAATAAHLHALASGKSICFKHGLGDEELVQEYRRALCVVLPSVYRPGDGTETRVPELLGQVLLEGMACGTAAICTDVASLPEIVEDWVTGFVVPAHDSEALGQRLRWLHEHPERAREMGRAGRQRVLERFTWRQVVRRCLQTYRDVYQPKREIARGSLTRVGRP
jgi:glycosyltransferase involved in cell wall biosynthesis